MRKQLPMLRPRLMGSTMYGVTAEQLSGKTLSAGSGKYSLPRGKTRSDQRKECNDVVSISAPTYPPLLIEIP